MKYLYIIVTEWDRPGIEHWIVISTLFRVEMPAWCWTSQFLPKWIVTKSHQKPSVLNTCECIVHLRTHWFSSQWDLPGWGLEYPHLGMWQNRLRLYLGGILSEKTEQKTLKKRGVGGIILNLKYWPGPGLAVRGHVSLLQVKGDVSLAGIIHFWKCHC